MKLRTARHYASYSDPYCRRSSRCSTGVSIKYIRTETIASTKCPGTFSLHPLPEKLSLPVLGRAQRHERTRRAQQSGIAAIFSHLLTSGEHQPSLSQVG